MPFSHVAKIWLKGCSPTQPLKMNTWFGNRAWDQVATQHLPSLEKVVHEGYISDRAGDDPKSSLGLIILLDQFSRHAWRGSEAKKVFTEADPIARRHTHDVINRGVDLKIPPYERLWVYMPLVHSESLDDHDLAVKKISEMIDSPDEIHKDALRGNLHFEHLHREVIAQFGRYPHRNEVLGRPGTPEEIKYLAEGGHTFG